MTIAEDSTAPQTKEIKKNFEEESEEILQTIIEKCDVGNVNVTNKVLKGKPGYAISKYAKDMSFAYLLIA